MENQTTESNTETSDGEEPPRSQGLDTATGPESTNPKNEQSNSTAEHDHGEATPPMNEHSETSLPSNSTAEPPESSTTGEEMSNDGDRRKEESTPDNEDQDKTENAETAPDPGIESSPPDNDEPSAKPHAQPHPLVQDSWSSLDREVLIDKVKGVIYGQAIGDALGLATEFMSKSQAAGYYSKDGPEKYGQIVQDFHRSRWEKGDWTDDTDQLLLILQMIVEGKGQVDKCAFAAKMDKWRKEGFKELGDYGGMGIGMTTAQTLSHHQFLTDPHQAARDIWERSGRYLAANGAVMRTAILGILEFNDLNRVVENTREVCLTTHADPRCLASCVAVTTAIALMLQGQFNLEKEKDLNKLVDEAIAHGQKMLEHKDQGKDLKKHIKASKLKELALDDKNTIGYTFKALGAGFYGLRTSQEFLPCLRKVIAEGGDADSNGSVCGALMGCKFGFSRLPEDLLKFHHRGWLDTQVENFLTTIGLN